MAKLSRVAAVLPAVGAALVASTLTGAAVYTVTNAGCAEPGQYVHRGGQVELVGGCLDPGDLPRDARPAPRQARQ